MTWVSLALALLKFVNGIMTWARERELISEGYREAIGDIAIQIATKVATKKQIQEKVDAMSMDEVDAGLTGLEPKS